MKKDVEDLLQNNKTGVLTGNTYRLTITDKDVLLENMITFEPACVMSVEDFDCLWKYHISYAKAYDKRYDKAKIRIVPTKNVMSNLAKTLAKDKSVKYDISYPYTGNYNNTEYIAVAVCEKGKSEGKYMLLDLKTGTLVKELKYVKNDADDKKRPIIKKGTSKALLNELYSKFDSARLSILSVGQLNKSVYNRYLLGIEELA